MLKPVSHCPPQQPSTQQDKATATHCEASFLPQIADLLPVSPWTPAEIAEERSAAARAAEAREIEVRAVEQRSAIEAAYSDAEMQVRNSPLRDL